MRMTIEVDLDYHLAAPGAAILSVEAAEIEGQQVLASDLRLDPGLAPRRLSGDEGIGRKIAMHVPERLTCRYRADLRIVRPVPDLPRLAGVPVEDLPAEALRALMPSRYCDPIRFLAYVGARFDELSGGPLVASLAEWVQGALAYVPGASSADTTATDTFVQRQGVCRDYAHLLIALCRAGQVPARIASVYSHSVEPQDFHAVVQVYLDGAWHLVDPTGMASADQMALVAVGRDAVDVAFLTTITPATMNGQSVQVSQIL
ncbi:transglutaminase-like domain-containing protein [Paracoccus sp. (in: a-proteobacteria)]|uniref:transglutaminase-like domain-containing protein n=1 Tax=Paracoccus sp. TaxID=267 RepID=UPI00272BBAC2|nr:transglutaminase family protein [Paracoccus sp. (in: a-proteobacteria)]